MSHVDLVNKLIVSAADAGVLKAVEAALEAGADVNAKDTLGVTPLHKAAHRGHMDIAVLLITKGADVNPRTLRQGETPLTYALAANHVAIADLLRRNHGVT